MIVGVSLALWMAFGGPKPPLPKLPLRTDGCDISSEDALQILNKTIDTTLKTSDDTSVFKKKKNNNQRLVVVLNIFFLFQRVFLVIQGFLSL